MGQLIVWLRCYPRIFAAFIAAVTMTFCASAQAQAWPQKPIRVLIGFATGGPPDLVGHGHQNPDTARG